ncbi:hypothetical protein BZL30_7036 [Mycobacterium kansasii]|uniref:Uncharacterized protein n=1 Tax=Mycobacterium kansasii TaxID=1768 RepID=A0A1V3WQ55_MYCKA|nr:hypothetical protein BZL30_7036 [Mycobacterium kansasii]
MDDECSARWRKLAAGMRWQELVKTPRRAAEAERQAAASAAGGAPAPPS